MHSKTISALRLLTACLLLACRFTSAQLVEPKQDQLPRNYLIRVKQFREFIGRFNYEKDFLNRDIGPAFSEKMPRERYIGLLFNSTPDVKFPVKPVSDTMAADFIRTVCNDSLYIDTYSDLVFAELKCRVTLKGENSIVYILARQEVDHGLKWSIASVHPGLGSGTGGAGEAFVRPSGKERTGMSIAPEEQDRQPDYIPPLSNETNFIVLKKVLHPGNNLGIYTAKQHNPERIGDFYRAVATGDLRFDYVETITYYVFDIPRWLMVIRRYQRDTANSGWLVSELLRLDGDTFPYFTERFGLSRIAD